MSSHRGHRLVLEPAGLEPLHPLKGEDVGLGAGRNAESTRLWVPAHQRDRIPPPEPVVRVATPTGYTDNGTAWAKDVQVKDTAPVGYADSGTAWVKTVGKTATMVPA